MIYHLNSSLQDFIYRLKQLKSLNPEELNELIEFLETHLDEERLSCDKMGSANKFIDFFVHDILDFSVLNQNEKNFTKVFTIFDIKVAVREILDMLMDKIRMKNIEVKEIYHGFEAYFFKVSTDQKRLQ